MSTVVPIPARMSHLSVQNGMAVPVVAIKRGDSYAISVNHTRIVLECIRQGLCGICGQPLSPGRAVVLTARLDVNNATDPANHPECAAYAMSACPMLSGRMARYRDQANHKIAGPCDVPDCGCGGYVVSDTAPVHRGEAAPERWYAVWISRYSPAIDPDGKPFGLAWNSRDVLRVREVPR